MTDQTGPTRLRRPALVIGIAAVILIAAAVVVAAAVNRPSTIKTATGVVVRVNAVSLTDVRSFELRTSAGEVMTFEIGQLDITPPGFNAQHLSTHAATAEPVAVTYEDRDGRHVAIRLTDAD